MPDELTSQSKCRELFATVQDAARSFGVSDVEALFGAHFGALTRFANNTIHQNVAEQDRWISVRVALDQKTARATTNRFDPDSIRSAVEQALALARSAAPNPDLMPLNEPSVISETKRFDAATAAATPSHRGRAVARSNSRRRRRGSNRRRHLLHRPKCGGNLQFARRCGLACRNDGSVFHHRHGRR